MEQKIYSYHKEENMMVYRLEWIIPEFLSKIKPGNYSLVYQTTSEPNKPASRFQLKTEIVRSDKGTIITTFYRVFQAQDTKVSLSCDYENMTNKLQSELKKVCTNQWVIIATLCSYDICIIPSSRYYEYDRFPQIFTFKIPIDLKIQKNSIMTRKITDDLKHFLANENFSDVTIKSTDGEEFRAHKLILVFRSEVLRAHFEHNMKENLTNTIQTTFESDVVKEVLTFIYTDEAPNVDKTAENLLAAADFYQINGLKNLCEKSLLGRLSIENAIPNLQLAELYSASLLKEDTLQFIKNGHAKLITTTEAWKNLQSVEIIKAIYE